MFYFYYGNLFITAPERKSKQCIPSDSYIFSRRELLLVKLHIIAKYLVVLEFCQRRE